MWYPHDFKTDYLIDSLKLYPKYCTEKEMYEALDIFIDTVRTRYETGRADWLPGPEIILECPGPFTQWVVCDRLKYISRDITHREAADPITLQYIRQHQSQTTFQKNAILVIKIKANSTLFTEDDVFDMIHTHATQQTNNHWTPILTTIGDKCTYGMQRSQRFIRLGCHSAKESDVEE